MQIVGFLMHRLICKFCFQNAIEDEIHFLMDCDFYSDIRRPLFLKAQTCNTDFNNLSIENKESVTIWPVYAYTLAAQNTVIKLLMLILYVEDNTSMSFKEIHA